MLFRWPFANSRVAQHRVHGALMYRPLCSPHIKWDTMHLPLCKHAFRWGFWCMREASTARRPSAAVAEALPWDRILDLERVCHARRCRRRWPWWTATWRGAPARCGSRRARLQRPSCSTCSPQRLRRSLLRMASGGVCSPRTSICTHALPLALLGRPLPCYGESLSSVHWLQMQESSIITHDCTTCCSAKWGKACLRLSQFPNCLPCGGPVCCCNHALTLAFDMCCWGSTMHEGRGHGYQLAHEVQAVHMQAHRQEAEEALQAAIREKAVERGGEARWLGQGPDQVLQRKCTALLCSRT